MRLLPWLVVGYVLTGFYSVQPNEQAIVRRFGRKLAQHRPPGLHFGFPYGIDRVTRVKTLEQKRVAVGMRFSQRELGRRLEPQQAECITGDRNLILVPAIVQYHVTEPESYLFHAADVPMLIRNITSAALADVVSSTCVDDVLTVERLAIQDRVKQATQEALDRYEAGVRITSVSLEGVAPPQEVKSAFDDVSAARGDQRRLIREAQTYANQLEPKTRAEADSIRLSALGDAQQTVLHARGDADRFIAVAAKLGPDRRLTFKRRLLETMERVFPRMKKIVLDDPNNAVDLGIFETQEQE